MNHKEELNKKDELYQCAKKYLIENEFITEAFDGTLHGTTSSNDSNVYIKANNFYDKNKLSKLFTLTEFRDEIKTILDSLTSDDALKYDINRIG